MPSLELLITALCLKVFNFLAQAISLEKSIFINNFHCQQSFPINATEIVHRYKSYHIKWLYSPYNANCLYIHRFQFQFTFIARSNSLLFLIRVHNIPYVLLLFLCDRSLGPNSIQCVSIANLLCVALIPFSGLQITNSHFIVSNKN